MCDCAAHCDWSRVHRTRTVAHVVLAYDCSNAASQYRTQQKSELLPAVMPVLYMYTLKMPCHPRQAIGTASCAAPDYRSKPYKCIPMLHRCFVVAARAY